MTSEEIYARLRELATPVAFTAVRELDPNFRWDSDGPDPAEDGYAPYDVDVRAMAIVDGIYLEGTASVGGCYMRDTDEIGDIGGYLPQMLEDAARELLQQLPKRHSVGARLKNVLAFLRQEMIDRYEAQQVARADMPPNSPGTARTAQESTG